jgi:phosphatidylserine/phosphatidylglycerophosphate/cardiolipin synthase-like enzyme
VDRQKLVCIDDRIAFAGGIDLTVGRWDTPAHEAGDPLRTNPE